MGLRGPLLALLLGVLFAPGDVRAAAPERLVVSQARTDGSSVTAYLDVLGDGDEPVEAVEAGQLAATLGAHPLRVVSVAPFETSGEAVAYILLVDVSASLSDEELGEMKAALKAFSAAARPGDRLALLTFGDAVEVEQDFTAPGAAFEAKVDALENDARSTLLYAGLDRAYAMARRRDADLPGRRVLVVLSDGKDEGSGLSAEDAVALVQREHVPIYALGYSDLREPERGKHLQGLHRLAALSGGLYREARGQSRGALRSPPAPPGLESVLPALSIAIRRVFVAKLACDACRADGQVYRLQVSLTAADTKAPGGAGVAAEAAADVLADGLDLRLLPPAVQVPTPGRARPAPPQPAVPERAFPWTAVGVGAAVVVAAALIALRSVRVRRQQRESAGGETLGPSADARTPEPPARLRLTVLHGTESGRQHELELSGSRVIGRAEGCDVVLPGDDEVSSRHCELLAEEGRVLAADLGSTNGTLINGVPIAGRRRLESGDRLLIGRTELGVQVERPS